MWRCLARTVEKRSDENPGEICPFLQVQIVWYLWGIRIIGPLLFLRVGHGRVYEGVKMPTGAGSNVARKIPR